MEHLAIERAVADAVRSVPTVTAAYLFGSLAAGRAHADSDVDVALLLDWEAAPTAAARFDARLELAATLSAALRRNDVDLVVLNDLPPLFARTILLDGRQVYVADAEREHAFRRDTMLRAADLEPFLRRTRQRKLAYVKR